MKQVVESIDAAIDGVPADSAHPGQAALAIAALEEARVRAVNLGILDGDIEEDDEITQRKAKVAESRAEAAEVNPGADFRPELETEEEAPAAEPAPEPEAEATTTKASSKTSTASK